VKEGGEGTRGTAHEEHEFVRSKPTRAGWGDGARSRRKCDVLPFLFPFNNREIELHKRVRNCPRLFKNFFNGQKNGSGIVIVHNI